MTVVVFFQDKPFYLSHPQFPHSQNGKNNADYCEDSNGVCNTLHTMPAWELSFLLLTFYFY